MDSRRSLHSLTALSLTLLALIPWTAARGQHMIWHSPLTTRAGNPELTIGIAIPAQAVRITSSAVGTFNASVALTLPSDVVIDSVLVCYESASTLNFITTTRLTSMTTPNSALVVHDDTTDRNGSTLACYAADEPDIVVDATITLTFRIEFTNTTDWIEIGAIGIKVRPASAAVGEAMPAPDLGGALVKQNHPNPFNPSTVIEYDLDRPGRAELRVYNSAGQLVRTRVDEEAAAGSHRARWDGRDSAGRPMASGVYYYELSAGDHRAAKQMLLLK